VWFRAREHSGSPPAWRRVLTGRQVFGDAVSDLEFNRSVPPRLNWFRPVLAAHLLCLISAGLLPGQPLTDPVLSLEEKEEFLKKAKIVRVRPVSIGLSGTLRATLSDGKLTHDASIQRVDFYALVFRTEKGTEIDFSDSFKFNIAAYRLARLLGIDCIPPSVERSYERKPAAFTWWIDGVTMDEEERIAKQISPPDAHAWNLQVQRLRVFDELIDNTDRNQGNLLITGDWKLWMIDHSRAFRTTTVVRNPNNLTACDGDLLARMKGLNMEMLTKELGKYLKKSEMKALLTRRDLIVEHLESRQ
jgi:hypothetical protein